LQPFESNAARETQEKRCRRVALVQQPERSTSLKYAFAKLSKQKLNFAPFGQVASTASSANKTTLLARRDTFAGP
jgi:hypothetical protein